MTKTSAIAALGALAQDTRLDIFRLLVERGPQGMPAGEIGQRLKQPSPTLSFHLNQLRYAGLITSRRESRSIIYRANFNAMNALMAYLTEKCCGGRPELCGPQVFPPGDCAEGTCAPGACEPIQIQARPRRQAATSAAAPRKRKARAASIKS
ncbi:MAG TPA: metalloregulator ArsR/SmtB family transcription factor [Candidatus Binataceae bacterium]|nr:metalloregulator ArsR/SmtB family transcription factor [Candidatus Binataceae bacterium]